MNRAGTRVRPIGRYGPVLAAALLLGLTQVPASPAGAQELLTNGDFETGDFTGWQEFPSAPGNITIASPGSSSSFAANINNTTAPSASLIKNANIGLGTVAADEDVMVSIDVKGSTAIGGVVFVELFSEISGGGVSKSEILGGGPLALDPDPRARSRFQYCEIARRRTPLPSGSRCSPAVRRWLRRPPPQG